jgi:hypothetical protein
MRIAKRMIYKDLLVYDKTFIILVMHPIILVSVIIQLDRQQFMVVVVVVYLVAWSIFLHPFCFFIPTLFAIFMLTLIIIYCILSLAIFYLLSTLIQES